MTLHRLLLSVERASTTLEFNAFPRAAHWPSGEITLSVAIRGLETSKGRKGVETYAMYEYMSGGMSAGALRPIDVSAYFVIYQVLIRQGQFTFHPKQKAFSMRL